MDRRDQGVPGSDFEPPAQFTIALPSTLLEITTKRTPAQQWDSSSLPNRIVLALFLSDFEIGGTDVITGFDLPRWAAFGVNHGPFPLAERTISELKPISQGDFEAIVNLATKSLSLAALRETHERLPYTACSELAVCTGRSQGFWTSLSR